MSLGATVAHVLEPEGSIMTSTEPGHTCDVECFERYLKEQGEDDIVVKERAQTLLEILQDGLCPRCLRELDHRPSARSDYACAHTPICGRCYDHEEHTEHRLACWPLDAEEIALDLEVVREEEWHRFHCHPGHENEAPHPYSVECLIHTLVDEGVDLDEARGRAFVLNRLISEGLCPRCGQDTLGIPGAARTPACRTVPICSSCEWHEVFHPCPVRHWPLSAHLIECQTRSQFPELDRDTTLEAREALRTQLVRQRWAAAAAEASRLAHNTKAPDATKETRPQMPRPRLDS